MTSSPSPSPAPARPGQLSPRELKHRLERGEPIQLVDVREEEELTLARLAHPFVHLPLSRSAEWLPQLENLLDRRRPVAVLCHAGVRSWHFSCWLIEQQAFAGDQVWNLRGGIDAWSVEVDAGVPRY
jgi:rhodanese-related sulfurtransferase